MKFDPLVKSEKNCLFTIADGKKIDCENVKLLKADEGKAISESSVSASSSGQPAIFALSLRFEDVDMGGGNYNEELLAALRDSLKAAEESGNFFFIQAESSSEIQDADQADSLIKAFVHAARRIKDCQALVGFSIPEKLLEKDRGSSLGEESWSRWFVNDMNVKHSHYVYFVQKGLGERLELVDEIVKTDYILYQVQ